MRLRPALNPNEEKQQEIQQLLCHTNAHLQIRAMAIGQLLKVNYQSYSPGENFAGVTSGIITK